MARKQRSVNRNTRAKSSTADWIYRVVCVSVLLVPLVVSPDGRDSFRLPKELAFRAEMVVLAALLLAGLVLKDLDRRALRWRHPAVLIAALAVAWTAVTTATSTNRPLSAPAFVYAAGTALVFAATMAVASRRGLEMLKWLAWAAIVNSVLYLGVALKFIQNPLGLTASYSGHYNATGLLGNANDVGVALLPVAICATAAALASKENRVFFSVTAVLSIATVLVSVSVAATGALLAAMASLAFVWNWKRAILAVLLIAVAVGVLAVVHQPLRYRVDYMVRAAGNADWDELSNGRLTAFTAAIEMFRDHPITGVGPGTFGWQYYPYKLEVSERRPDLLTASNVNRFNFEETHNDHLEVLAETGAPGFLLFFASLLFVASGSLRRSSTPDEPDDKARFSRLAQLPLAVGTAVVALAQYPLQLTSALTTLVFLVAVCTAWRPDLEPVLNDEGGRDA